MVILAEDWLPPTLFTSWAICCQSTKEKSLFWIEQEVDFIRPPAVSPPLHSNLHRCTWKRAVRASLPLCFNARTYPLHCLLKASAISFLLLPSTSHLNDKSNDNTLLTLFTSNLISLNADVVIFRWKKESSYQLLALIKVLSAATT